MDARTVADAADVPLGTLNVWIQRKLIPGLVVGARGRMRDVPIDAAIHIAVMATLVRLGLGAPFASYIASARRQHKRLVFANSPGSPLSLGGSFAQVQGLVEHFEASSSPFARLGTAAALMHSAVPCIGFDADEDLSVALAKFPGGPPAAYVVIDVERMAAAMGQLQAAQ